MAIPERVRARDTLVERGHRSVEVMIEPGKKTGKLPGKNVKGT